MLISPTRLLVKVVWFLYLTVMDELKEWMREQFKRSSHTKYHRYFDEWWDNALSYQLEYFKQQMHCYKNNVLGILNNGKI